MYLGVVTFKFNIIIHINIYIVACGAKLSGMCNCNSKPESYPLLVCVFGGATNTLQMCHSSVELFLNSEVQ